MVKSRMNLFTPIVPTEKQNPNFRNILLRNNKYELDVINEWAQGFIDRDGKFVKEFQLSFNSCFWELYLFAAFKQIGASVDFSYAAPDFLVSSDKQTFIAEAVIASHAQGYAPEWEREVTMDAIEDLDLSVLVSYSAIRLANAITSKHKKHVHGYAHLPHVKGRPFVLCLAAFEQPYFYAQNTQALSRVLYGYDKPIVIKKPDSGESFLVGETWAEVEVKESGSEIELGFFTDERMSEISAVIFSTTATYGKIQALRADMDALILFHAQKYNPYSINPSVVQEIKKDYEETLLDGLHICINPYAQVPFDLDVFKGQPVAIHTYDSDDGYELYMPPGFLLQRTNYIIEVRDQLPDKKKQSEKTYKKPQQPDILDGILFSVPGVVGGFTATHMAFYKGWTIVIAFDLTDKDWMVQFLQGRHHTIHEYIAANRQQEPGAFIVDKTFGSKEDALTAAQAEIDKHLLST